MDFATFELYYAHEFDTDESESDSIFRNAIA